MNPSAQMSHELQRRILTHRRERTRRVGPAGVDTLCTRLTGGPSCCLTGQGWETGVGRLNSPRRGFLTSTLVLHILLKVQSAGFESRNTVCPPKFPRQTPRSLASPRDLPLPGLAGRSPWRPPHPVEGLLCIIPVSLPPVLLRRCGPGLQGARPSVRQAPCRAAPDRLRVRRH